MIAAFLLAAAAYGQGDPKLFDYDAAAPIDYQEKKISAHDGIAVYDASFASPKGGRVVCYVVAPERKTKRKFAGIVWQHGGGQDRQWFLPDAVEMARAGAVSILMDAPFNRPVELQGAPPADSAERQRHWMMQVAVDARRSFDVLAARGDVDQNRIGYVGLSFGAMMGASLAGVDERFRTFVFIAGLEGFVRHYKRSQHPEIARMRTQMKADEFERLLAAVAPIDAIHYIGKAKAPKLFQAARFDIGVSEADTYDFYAAAGSPKDLRWYDAGHQINDPKAFADRAAWFRKHLGTR